MKYRKLGKTEVEVSVICLGTMTWGEQNTEKEGHEQLDYAVSKGVNFIDTAELYPVPAKAETYATTEKVIGNWLQKRKKRDDLVIASKIAGPSGHISHIRGGKTQFNSKQIKKAVEDSLFRLKTDYIDLYQLHWPERKTNFFGKLAYEHVSDEVGTPVLEILKTAKELISEGKIRFLGLSNETPWGIHRFLCAAELHNLPRVVSIQNPYSLVNRSYEVGNAEMSIREQVGLLAYSPLAGGYLTGKYIDGKKPAEARATLFPNFMARYQNEHTYLAVKAYTNLAKKMGLTPTQLALAFVNSRPFLTSNIIGATKMEQLRENINTYQIELEESIVSELDKINLKFTYPAP